MLFSFSNDITQSHDVAYDPSYAGFVECRPTTLGLSKIEQSHQDRVRLSVRYRFGLFLVPALSSAG